MNPESTNSFTAQDIPNAPGTWWEFECGPQVSYYQDGLELHREVYKQEADALSMQETFTVHDTIIVVKDTCYYKLTKDAFSFKVDGQWKELLRFPVNESLNWTTFDGDRLVVESTMESVTLPIGNFNNCIKVVSQKDYKAYYYAYGLGMILVEDLKNPGSYLLRLSASSQFL